ncbi:hypothetical protein L7F22_014192 [Adiantum nelumboides]|nr:hypothetical protein [Adiantum nelumboides]
MPERISVQAFPPPLPTSSPFIPPPPKSPLPQQLLIKDISIPTAAQTQMMIPQASSTAFQADVWKSGMEEQIQTMFNAYAEKEERHSQLKTHYAELNARFAYQMAQREEHARVLHELQIAYHAEVAEMATWKKTCEELTTYQVKQEELHRGRIKEIDGWKRAHQMAVDSMTLAQSQIQQMLSMPLQQHQPPVPSVILQDTSIYEENEALKQEVQRLKAQLAGQQESARPTVKVNLPPVLKSLMQYDDEPQVPMDMPSPPHKQGT